MNKEKIINDFDLLLEEEEKRLKSWIEKRQKLSERISMSQMLENNIGKIENSYEGNLEKYRSIDEGYEKVMFGFLTRIVLRPKYIGKSINGQGLIQVRFYSESLNKVIEVHL